MQESRRTGAHPERAYVPLALHQRAARSEPPARRRLLALHVPLDGGALLARRDVDRVADERGLVPRRQTNTGPE